MRVLALAALTGCVSSHAAPVAVDDTVSLPDIAEQVVRGVVSVNTRRPGVRSKMGAGSGVLIGSDGVIVSNHHVIFGAESLSVTLHDGRTFPVTVVGSDKAADVAVLRMTEPPENLQPLQWGDSESLRLGETVLAVGNPFGMGHTLTRGIVSAKSRANVGMAEYEDYIQTDAAINPGNSGGALVDLNGELVGIPTMIMSRNGGSNGIGLAISAKLARALADDLLQDGKVDRGWLGVAIAPDPSGVLLRGVGEDSAAQKAGLLALDVITVFDGEPVTDLRDFRQRVANSGPDERFTMQVLRDGKTRKISGTLGRRPDAPVIQ